MSRLPYPRKKRLTIQNCSVYLDMKGNNMRSLSVPEKHQLAIARKTLLMSDVGALIMGGPSKQEAGEIILRLTRNTGNKTNGK